MGAKYGGVIFRAKPSHYVMIRNVLHIVKPLLKGFQLSVLVDKLCGQVILHTVSAECREHFVIGAKLFKEQFIACRIAGSRQPFYGGLIEQTKRFFERITLYVVAHVHPVVDVTQHLCEDFLAEFDTLLQLIMKTSAHAAAFTVEVVH